MEKGLIPPHSKDAEEIVLGQLLIDEEAVNDVDGILTSESFYIEKNRVIYRCINELYKNNEPANLLTLVQKLMRKGELDKVGGPAHISELTNKVSSSAHIETHAKIIAQNKIRRDIISVSRNLFKDAYKLDNDIDDMLSEFQSKSLSIGSEFDFSKEISLHEALQNKIKRITDTEAPSKYITSKFEKINKLCNGWGGGCLIGIGGRPSHGKSVWMLNDAVHQAENGIPTVIFSLEMQEEEVATRAACINTGLDPRKLDKGELTSKEWTILDEELDRFKTLPLYIESMPKLSVYTAEKRIKKLCRDKGVRCVYIDYLQLMDGDPKFASNKNYYIGSITRRLKQLAMELDIPIVVLCQLSREVDKRPLADRLGKMSDLKDSGDIEQDLDIAGFIMMPWRYGVESMELPASDGGVEEVDVKYKALLNFDKVRGGTTGLVVLENSRTRMCWTNENEKADSELPF